MVCNCFGGDRVSQVHSDSNEAEHTKALQGAEDLLKFNASRLVTDKYTLGADIGSGAFAKVVTCMHKETGDKYACKIAPCTVGQQDRHMSIIKEIAIMHQVGMHPCALACYDAYKDTTSYYIIMELCLGGELFDLIAHKYLLRIYNHTFKCPQKAVPNISKQVFQELNEKQTAQMMWCLIDFLAFMHSKGVMHRDVKPENILMSSKEKDASIRVVDFGTADFCAPNQRLFNKFGTVLYVAPEVLGSAGHQCSCDVWSAGVIMYILLSGYPPFNGPNERAILKQVKRGQYTFAGSQWDGISTEAKQCIKNMLAFKPSKRATAAQLLQQTWLKQAQAIFDKEICQKLLHMLRLFAAMPHYQRLALFLLTCTLPEADTRALKESFWHLDGGQDGRLRLSDVQHALAKGGIPLSDNIDVAAMFDAADISKSGELDFITYTAIMTDKHYISRHEHLLQNAFKQVSFDSMISADSLTQYIAQRTVLSPPDLHSLLQKHDLAKPGKMGYEEFKALLLGAPGSSMTKRQSMPKSLRAWSIAALPPE